MTLTPIETKIFRPEAEKYRLHRHLGTIHLVRSRRAKLLSLLPILFLLPLAWLIASLTYRRNEVVSLKLAGPASSSVVGRLRMDSCLPSDGRVILTSLPAINIPAVFTRRSCSKDEVCTVSVRASAALPAILRGPAQSEIDWHFRSAPRALLGGCRRR